MSAWMYQFGALVVLALWTFLGLLATRGNEGRFVAIWASLFVGGAVFIGIVAPF